MSDHLVAMRCCVAALIVLLAGCTADTTILVVVNGELAVPDELDTLDIRVQQAGEEVFRRAFELSAATPLPQSIGFRFGSNMGPMFPLCRTGT